MRCIGCGALLGLRAPSECHCWRSINKGALIPERIRGIPHRVMRLYQEEKSEVQAVLFQRLNVFLRAGGLGAG